MKKYAVVGIGLAMVIALVFSSYRVYNPSPQITIYGQAQTTEPGSHPATVALLDLSTGQAYAATVQGSGSYTITVPHDSSQFETQLHWQTASGASGTCNAQIINAPSAAAQSLRQDLIC
jgi:hypothetical protein